MGMEFHTEKEIDAIAPFLQKKILLASCVKLYTEFTACKLHPTQRVDVIAERFSNVPFYYMCDNHQMNAHISQRFHITCLKYTIY